MGRKTPKERKEISSTFFQRYKKWFIALFIIFLLFTAFNIFLVLLKLQFSVGEEIILQITPNTNSVFLNFGETKEIVFSINATNAVFCTASCSYSFEDISLSKEIDQGTFSLYGHSGLSKAYNLSVEKLGTGQNLYNFKVSCKNKQTLFCATDEQEKSSISLIILNYDLSEAQKELKKRLRPALSEFLLAFNTTDYKLQEINNKFFALATQINVEDLIIIKNSVNEIFNNLQVDIEGLKVLWYNQSYFELDSEFDDSYSQRNNEILGQIAILDRTLDDKLKEHNERINIFNALLSNDYKELASLNYIAHDNSSLIILGKLKVLLSDLGNSIVTNNFANSQLDQLLNEANNIFYLLKQTSLKNFNIIDTEGKHLLNFEFDMLCNTKGKCFEHATLKDLKHDRELNNSELAKNCKTIEELKDIHNKEKNLSSDFMRNNLSNYNQSVLNQTLLSLLNHLKINLTNKYVKEFNEILNTNSTLGNYSISALNTLIPDNESSEPGITNPLNIAHDKLLAAISLEIQESLNNYSSKYCNRALTYSQQNFSLYLPNISPLTLVVFETNFTPIQKVNVTLEEIPPICCVFNKCNPCCSDEKCANNPELYPIILLHGHSFNKQNTAEYSLDAFNKIIARLEKKGYLNAGVITPLSSYSEFIKGEWGLSGKPVLVKGSYYYTSYFNLGQNVIVTQKSENIETYAIRLKELIDLVKYRTGKEKVIIIAHSMGGLVARSYIQIFSDQSIHKLILIATPNHGIEGSINDYCPILGERKECSDMSASSIFINRLNTAEPLRNAKIYTISGKGCKTVNEDGDGIVTLNSTQLSYAKNYAVEGNCTSVFGTDLHKDLLNIDKYKTTMDFIEIILEEEIR